MASSSKRGIGNSKLATVPDLVLRPGTRPSALIDFEGNTHYCCARCDADIGMEELFCPACDSAIGWVRELKRDYRCGGCGEPLERQWTFCPACTCEIDWA